MILADTSAWIEHDWATGSAVDERLTALIASEELLAVTEPVMMEVLAGARTQAAEDDLRLLLLLRCELLPFNSVVDFAAAVRVYRRCRQAGITSRGLLDCMVAAVAWRQSAILLSYDADLDRIAGVNGARARRRIPPRLVVRWMLTQSDGSRSRRAA